MSLRTSNERSISDQVADLRSIDLSSVDHGVAEKSPAKRLVAGDATPSLRHFDIFISITGHDPRAEQIPEGASCFYVVAKRPIHCSEDTGHPSADRDNRVARQLSEALAAAEAALDHRSAVCADALRLAILTRQLRQVVHGRYGVEQPAVRTAKSLQEWRLKRVLQYVDDHMAAKITLQDLATAAGLSRMHFAAQFRVAMRLRPHQYLLKRRIERAQELLKQTEASLVDVALTVGFQTQAHFTTVFKRFAGDTPHQWRRAHLAQCAAMQLVRAS
jgi:AraC-like DNA-binding protein